VLFRSSPIPAEDWNREHAFCAICHAPFSALVFPAFFPKTISTASGTALLEDGEASCFYHPRKRAVVPCDQCGRFLCSLCQVEFLGQNWCPGCIETRRQKGQLSALDPRRPLYDNMVLAVAILPAPLLVPTIISAPMSLYMALRYWRAPSSILPRTKIRFWIAALLAFLQIGLWVWLVAYLIYRR
jgi:hypothetical protein